MHPPISRSEEEEEVPETPTDDGDVEDSEPVTLRPNRFRPKAGTRSRVRTVLHQALKEDSTPGEGQGEEQEEEQRCIWT